MRKMSHKPVGVDVLGDPFGININASSYYIVQTHIPVPLAFPNWERLGLCVFFAIIWFYLLFKYIFHKFFRHVV